MTLMIATSNPPITPQTLLSDRFILTQVEGFRLVFPATWVAEIWRFDRSEILDLPFYNPLLLGIINHNTQITPLIAAARLLEPSAPHSLKEQLIVVKLNELADRLANIGVVVDRAIGGTTRPELPPALFESSSTTTDLVLMRTELIPPHLWQPQRWG